MLGRIATVTITTTSLSESEEAYTTYLGYKVVDRGKISAGMAMSWKTPAIQNNDYVIMSPGNGVESYLRFVEVKELPHFEPYKSYGWNAIEIIVSDVDSLPEVLTHSPFQILGQPANLSISDDIRAMQVIGPSQEVLYLTEIKAEIPGLDLPRAEAPVDRPFIIILGGPTLAHLKDYYSDTFAIKASPDSDVRVTAISTMYGLPRETLYSLSVFPLKDQCYIEADALPSGAADRIVHEGHLPPGIAMVSFEVNSLEHANLKVAGESFVAERQPYAGRRSVTLHGAVGEWIELIETNRYE